MKVCFFSPTAYSYFNPDSDTWAGGAETQQVLIARHMARRGIDVSFIGGDYGQADVELVEGITLIKSFRPFTGNRKLRFVPDMRAIWRAMRIADADVYNQRSTSFYTGQLAYFARRLGRRFTFSIGIDYNCYPDCAKRLPFPLTHLYRYGLRSADAVIAQTEEQQRLVRRHFKLDAVLIRNGIVIPRPEGGIGPERALADGAAGAEPTNGGETAAQDGDPAREFLWVGSFRRRKRPHMYLELARRMPGARFTMIGGAGDDQRYFEKIARGAEEAPNIRYVGFVHPDAIDGYYRRAYAFINTSDLEGFPNTYLHSWIWGTPTLTMEIDPDGIIARNGIGLAAGGFEGLVGAVRSLCENPAIRSEMSRRAYRYVREHHDIADRGDDYIRLFERLLSPSARSASRRSG
jgi:glycosyltransferase involved in cell wall biosynthesis